MGTDVTAICRNFLETDEPPNAEQFIFWASLESAGLQKGGKGGRLRYG